MASGVALIQAGRNLIEKQGFRYLVVGGLNTAFGYVAFSLGLLVFGLPYLAALVVAHVFGVTFAFTLYRNFVFDTNGSVWVDYLRCHLVYLGQLALSATLLTLFTEVGGFHPMVSLLFTLVATVIVSFFGHKHVTFRR